MFEWMFQPVHLGFVAAGAALAFAIVASSVEYVVDKARGRKIP
jgi:hypothetical protein